MDHRRDREFPEGCGQRPGIANIALDETRTDPGDGLDAFQHADGTVRQVVENHQIAAGLQQFDDRVRADVAGAAGNQDHFQFRP